MVPDIDRATRDPRTPEDLINAVELYGSSCMACMWPA